MPKAAAQVKEYELVESDEPVEEVPEDAQQTVSKLEQDLKNIQSKKEEMQKLAQGLGAQDSKEFQRLLKEKDKLEREALVQRMLKRDA